MVDAGDCGNIEPPDVIEFDTYDKSKIFTNLKWEGYQVNVSLQVVKSPSSIGASVYPGST